MRVEPDAAFGATPCYRFQLSSLSGAVRRGIRFARADPFAPLQPETLRAIAATGVVRTFPKNTVLINEGDVGDALYVILSGRVKVFASNEAGREFVIDFHGPGEYVGEMTLDGAPRSASVITVEPTTCAVVNRAHFRDFILAHPDFAHAPHRAPDPSRAGHHRQPQEPRALGRLRPHGAPAQRARGAGRAGKLVVPEKLTQQDIADRVGASRDMIGKLMKDLTAGGYLQVEDRTITILRKLPTGW